jgi:hypothetical protein
LSTILLCTWVTLHPNISITPDTPGIRGVEAKLRGFLKNRLLLFIWALLVPEYILAWAIRQHLKAGEIERECNTLQKSTNKNPTPAQKWTRAHGFFLVMGGFHLYSLPEGAPTIPYPPELSMPSKFVLPLNHSREVGNAEYPLEFKDLTADYNALAHFAPTETEIKDKGKADIIAKILAILQTSWFVAQCIARGVSKLPLTELEVVTLAYATMNVFIYYFWWDKPKDVGCPIRVYMVSKADGVESREKVVWKSGVAGIIYRIIEYVTGGQDKYFNLSEESQVPMFWSGKPGITIEERSMLGASILGMVFGAIHFTSWNSEFPSHIELILWRVSCVTVTAVPLTVTILCGILQTFGDDSWLIIIIIIPVFALPLTGLLYIFARIATLVMAFTTLRALPLSAFKTVDWATFIPHL